MTAANGVRGSGQERGANQAGGTDGAGTSAAGSPQVAERERRNSDLPNGFQVQIDMRSVYRGDLRHLVGGSPSRLLNMSDEALGLTSAEGRIEVCDERTRKLARTLLDAGIAHPRPMFGPAADTVTVVIPVRDNQTGLDRLLSSLVGLQVIVVDDGSQVPVGTPEGVRLIRFNDNRGPAAARNAGAAAADTELVAFLDSDVVPSSDWLTKLLGHFSDPLVAVVAPRIVAHNPDSERPKGHGLGSLLVRYENGYSALDMGPRESAVAPGARLAYVPSAAMIVRRRIFNGFDESLRVAEDVDLCWRLHREGARLRFDPVAEVAHEHRNSGWAVLNRRRFYGTGAAHLAARHGTTAAPLVMSTSMLSAVGALLTRTRWGMALAVVLLIRNAWRLRGHLGVLPQAPVAAAKLTGRATGFGFLQVAAALCRHYWPVAALLAAFWPRFRRLLLQVALTEGIIEWTRSVLATPNTTPPMGPVTYLIGRRLTDAAYGIGLWEGVFRHADGNALRPVLLR